MFAFDLWKHIDSPLRGLVCKMTCMDPSRRITARAEDVEAEFYLELVKAQAGCIAVFTIVIH